VVTEEPLPAGSALRKFDQVILTPHTGADSVDSMDHVRRTVVDTIEAVARGYWPPFPVNPKVAPRFHLRPFSDWARP
jgi:phosphoglycerate dehydrogenase-like enzyme